MRCRNDSRPLFRALLVAALLVESVAALQPPTPEQVSKYKKDGTWAQRLERARALGNHRFAPGLVARWRQKLQGGKHAVAPTAGEGATLNAPPPAWQGGLPASGTPKTLVLLVDFTEYPHYANQTAADVQSKFFGDGDVSRYPYESLRNFYQRSSYNQLTIGGDVLGWYRAQHNRSYYQAMGFDAGNEALIMEALNYFDAEGHDFSQYDNDGDGAIDALYIKWTGPNNGWANFWWAYQTEWWANQDYRIDGKSLHKYVWSWISSPEGQAYQARTDIHETGHLLGLPDLYDYDNAVGPRGGVGRLDMMDANWGDHNCFSKFLLGWLTPTTIADGSQFVALNPSGTSQNCVLMMSGAAPGNAFGEFFMAQYRKRATGNDPSDYPTDGLLIWHIDSTLNGGGEDFLYDNSYSAHKLVKLMEADGFKEIEQNLSVDAGDYYLPPATFELDTTPNSRSYAGNITGVQVDGLTPASQTMGANFRVLAFPQVVAAGAAIEAQACSADANLDPQEVATVSFSLRNIGTGPTGNLTATLLTTGGIAAPSGAQNYGVLTEGGAAVARSFTFKADALCGNLLTATLQLEDGVNLLNPVTFTFQVGAPASTAAENFDAVAAPALPAGWSATVGSGSVAPWATSTAAADTAPNALFAADPDFVSDNWVESPAYEIDSPFAQLTFRHRYELESTYDGGALEISIGGGAFTDVADAGGTFLSGGYNGFISTGGNPLGGHRAWTGSSQGFITTTVMLPTSAAGQSVRLRWRLGSDVSVSGPGWYVDTVSLTTAYVCCSTASPDFNGDHDVDQGDYLAMEGCGFRPFTAPPGNCSGKDLDMDGDVDQSDFGILQRCFSGDGQDFDLNCLNTR